MARLEQLISADTIIRNQYTALSSRIAQENNALKTLETRLTDAQGAAARRKALQTEREAAYGRVFDAIISGQNVLVDLYAPLMTRLSNSPGTLRKLSFSVSRIVDASEWADFAEDKLIDCRKSGPFYWRGSLTALANSELKPAWETGSAVQIQAAMASFITKYWKDLLKHAPYVPLQKLEFRTWLKQFAQWNANLVINTDADQIIIADAGSHAAGGLPPISYIAGGLEDANIRKAVCDIPEGGEDAFRERARRMRVRLER